MSRFSSLIGSLNGWAVLEDLPLSVYIKNREHQFVYANQATVAALGVASLDDLLGKSDRDFFTAEVAQKWEEQEKELLSGQVKRINDQVELEALQSLKMQDAHWVMTCKHPLTDAGGEIIGLIGISKRIDEEHRDFQMQTALILSAQVGLWFRDMVTKEAWYSPRWKEMLGYKDDEISNDCDAFRKLVLPEDWPKVQETYQDYLQNWQEKPYFECEFRMLHKSGECVWIRSHGQGQFDAEGNPLKLAGSHVDVSAPRDLHELHEAILEMLPALVFLKDEEKRFKFVNPTLAKFFGTTKADIEASRYRDRDINANKAQVAKFEEDDEKILNGDGGVLFTEELLTDLSGKTENQRILQTVKKLFRYPSRHPKNHVLGISTDITDSIHQIERHKQKLKATLEWLTETIIQIEQAGTADAACREAIRRLAALAPEEKKRGSTPPPACPPGAVKAVGHSFMISFLTTVDGRPAIVADERFATGGWKPLAGNTIRYADLPEQRLDILPWTLKNERPVFVQDSRLDTRCDRGLCREHGIVSQYIIPLRSKFFDIGTLQIAIGCRKSKPEDHAVYEAVAASLSLAIERYRLAGESEHRNRNLQDQKQQLEKRTEELEMQRLELEEANLALKAQYSMITRAEIISLLAHDLGHKAIAVTEEVRDFSSACRKALRDKLSTDSMDAQAATVEQACTMMEQEIGKIRVISKNVDEEPGLFDVREVIHETARTLQNVMDRYKMRFDLATTGSMECFGPREVFSKALFNLFSNAIDAQKSRQRLQPNTIHIHCRTEAQGDLKNLIIHFWDEGPGIIYTDFQDVTRIFEIGTTSKPGQGTGTGLPISRSLLGRYFKASLDIKDRKPPLFEIKIPIHLPKKSDLSSS